MTKIGGHLKLFRRKLGISQLELSHRSGLSQASIARIEANKQKNITVDTLGKLADALEIPLADLIEEPEIVKEEAAPYAAVRMLHVAKLERFIDAKGKMTLKDMGEGKEPSLSTDPKAFFLKAPRGFFTGVGAEADILMLIEPSIPVENGNAALLLSHKNAVAGRLILRPPVSILQPFRHGAEPIVLESKSRKRDGARLFKIVEIREKY